MQTKYRFPLVLGSMIVMLAIILSSLFVVAQDTVQDVGVVDNAGQNTSSACALPPGPASHPARPARYS